LVHFTFLLLEDTEEFYERDDDQKKELPSYYKDHQEMEFYNDDIDFLAHHKRTKKNMIEALNDLLVNTSKQGVTSGIKESYVINMTEVKLNRACSLLHVWWDIFIVDDTPFNSKS